MIIQIVVFSLILIASFYLMAKIVDDYFITSLDKMAKRLDMSSDAAGATLMAMGSSSPELFIAVISLIKGFLQPGEANETIGVGTIVGSAIFNVLVIVGAAAVARKAVLRWQPMLRDLLFYIVSISALLWAFSDFQVTLVETMVFALLYIGYVITVINWENWVPHEEGEYDERPEDEPEDYRGWRRFLQPIEWALDRLFPKTSNYIGIFVLSIIYIAGLSWVLVESAVVLSHALDIPKAIIGLTVLAVGTSVPDLLSSVIVAKQGRGGMAISNSIGSNVFDILIGLGLPWLITVLITGQQIEVVAQNLLISALILFGSVLLVIMLLLIRRWHIDAKTGWFFIIIYIGYISWEIFQILH